MIVKIIPGPRNEELIEKIREAKKNGEDIGDIFEPSSELYDALYYTCECGDIMLEDQRWYLEWLLYEEETEHYIERMFTPPLCHSCVTPKPLCHAIVPWHLRESL